MLLLLAIVLIFFLLLAQQNIFPLPNKSRYLFSFSVRGGINEIFRLFWSKAEVKKETMFYLDRNAFYCYMAMIHWFPIGSYVIFGFYELQDILFNQNHFQLKDGTEIFGLALVRVLCPQKCELPFLPYRSTVSGRNCLPCCKTCADHGQLRCHHSKM